MKSDEICIAKIEPVSNTHCNVELIFNGAVKVIKEEIHLDEATHVETINVSDEHGVVVETSHQVGEAGYKPFIDKLKESYPNAMVIDQSVFDTVVAEQKKQADKLRQNDGHN